MPPSNLSLSHSAAKKLESLYFYLAILTHEIHKDFIHDKNKLGFAVYVIPPRFNGEFICRLCRLQVSFTHDMNFSIVALERIYSEIELAKLTTISHL